MIIPVSGQQFSSGSLKDPVGCSAAHISIKPVASLLGILFARLGKNKCTDFKIGSVFVDTVWYEYVSLVSLMNFFTYPAVPLWAKGWGVLVGEGHGTTVPISWVCCEALMKCGL